MDQLQKNLDSKFTAIYIKSLVVIGLLTCLQTNISKASDDLLDPVSLLSTQPVKEITEPKEINKTAEITQPTIETQAAQQDLSKSLKSFKTLLAANFKPQKFTMVVADPPVIQKPNLISENDIEQKKLMSEKISAVIEIEESPNKDLLQNLINQVGTIKFKDKAGIDKIEPPIPPLTDELPGDTENQDQNTNNDAQENEVKRTLDPAIIEKIEILKTQPQNIEQPYLLAELLHLNGYLEYAVYFYNMALADETSSQQIDKAWVLLQKANCQKQYNPAKSVETYTQIISDYPDSPWVQPAQANQDLLNLYIQQQPQELIELCKEQLSNSDKFNGVSQK